MLPENLRAEQFAKYPPQAEKLAVAHLPVLRQLPLSFLPSLLRELIEYDFMFPAERVSFDRELATLSALTPAQIDDWFHAFAQIHLSAANEQLDWVGQPAQFTEQLSAYLWSTHQMDAFRNAATAYSDRMRALTAPEPLPMNRLGIAVIGQGVAAYDGPLFRKLREHGTYFSRVKPDQGLDQLLAAVAARAQTHSVPYAHWYVDGGTLAPHSPALTCISYAALAPAREVLLKDIQREVEKAGMGPEELHSRIARLSPAELGIGDDTLPDRFLLDRFQVKLLTEGSGTQIFSTTFAQWTAREVLRRAEALTLLVRFAPRQRERPMSELLSSNPVKPALDPLGSLVDADMAAYYHWINQQRLPESRQSSFVAWFEGHNQAVAIGPSLPRGTESTSPVDLKSLISLAVG
jgi:hypothetical protein